MTPLPLAALMLSVLQQPRPAIRVDQPNATLRAEFSDIRGIREIGGGRVVIVDYRDQRVVVGDFARGDVAVMARTGSGPAEVRLPMSLVPLSGDSLGVADYGNQRLLVLDPAGRPARTIPGDRPGQLGVRGLDRTGAWYYTIPAWVERDRALPNDSVRLVRWEPASGAERRVATVQGDRMRSDIRKPSRVPRIPTVGYARRDGWLPAADGLWIVRGDRYRVEWHPTGKPPVVGPAYGIETPAVTPQDRIAYVKEFNATSPMSGRGEDGGMGFSPGMSDAETAAMAAGTEFATHHPDFSPGRLHLDAEGQLWVGVVTPGAPTTRYDRFDTTGRRTGSLTLPADRRIAAFGRGALYAIRTTDDGLQYVERYALSLQN
ncbi:MAG: hypothetical protein R2882_09085 [Gemmatimonadales bacterium]